MDGTRVKVLGLTRQPARHSALLIAGRRRANSHEEGPDPTAVEHWKHVYDEDVAIHLTVSFVHCGLGYPDRGKKKNGAVKFLNHKNANSGKYEGKPKKKIPSSGFASREQVYKVRKSVLEQVISSQALATTAYLRIQCRPLSRPNRPCASNLCHTAC
jgi:hypothetical protein